MTIDDARRRLLTKHATVIPSGATVHAQAVELRVGEVAGFACDDFNLFATDATQAPKGTTGCKLQYVPDHCHKKLSKPLQLFDFDFATGDLRALAAGRTRDDLSALIEADGVLTAFLVHFSLRCDESGSNTFHSGPSNSKLVAWDQSLRVMPIELRVRKGERLKLFVEHSHEAVKVGLPAIRPEMLRDASGRLMVGHREVLPPSMLTEAERAAPTAG